MKRMLLILPLLFISLQSFAAKPTYLLGDPVAIEISNSTNEDANVWLRNPDNNSIASAAYLGNVNPNTKFSSEANLAGKESFELASPKAGFPFQSGAYEYYLGDELLAPGNVDWHETYHLFEKDGMPISFIFDTYGQKVYVAAGGEDITFKWVLNDGTVQTNTYVVSTYCRGRPKKIFNTALEDGTPIDLSGKFVKLYGNPALFELGFGVVTNNSGSAQLISSNITSGVYIDSSSHMLYASGERYVGQQFVVAYYDSSRYDNLLHVTPVDIHGSDVVVQRVNVGDELKPNGLGYDIEGLHAVPKMDNANPTDGYGAYIYQHTGAYSYSPKNRSVFAIRPNKNEKYNRFDREHTQVGWWETDEMEVDWPFEIDQYEVEWGKDTPIFVRGNYEDKGRAILIPSDYTAELMSYQEPVDHARAVTSDGEFVTTGEGYSLLRLTANDNIWFIPIHSVLRTNTNYFTLAKEEWSVADELILRGGIMNGATTNFTIKCSPAYESAGYVYKPASGTHYNPKLYYDPLRDNTNTYQSVIYGINTGNKPIEVWWNTVVNQEDMPKPIEIPCLPQVYEMCWPTLNEIPEIVIASQKGAACESIYLHNEALHLTDENASAEIGGRNYFNPREGMVEFWVRPVELEKDYFPGECAFFTIGSGLTDEYRVSFDMQHSKGTNKLVVTTLDKKFKVLESFDVDVSGLPNWDGWFNVALAIYPEKVDLYYGGTNKFTFQNTLASKLLESGKNITIGRFGRGEYTGTNGMPVVSAGKFARRNVQLGKLLFWSQAKNEEELIADAFSLHDGTEVGLSGCFTFVKDVDLVPDGVSNERRIYDKTLGIAYTAHNCMADTSGPPAVGNGIVKSDGDAQAYIYYQNTKGEVGYNPNEEHAIIQNGGEGIVAWALRNDLNLSSSSLPFVFVSYVKDARPAMECLSIVVTNSFYPRLEGTATAGLALPGPHPLDFFDNPWTTNSFWRGVAETVPFHRDRKGQFWARAAGKAEVFMYYPNQPSFAYPEKTAPAVGAGVPWLNYWEGNSDESQTYPSPWTWTVEWPKEIPEIEIGRTLTTAASGLPEVWNAKSAAIIWPGNLSERTKTAVLFDPTVAQSSGFSASTYATVSAAISGLGIQVGKGGNATLRKGKYYFNDLPPTISERFYLDTTMPVKSCLQFIGKKEDNPGGVALLHVNVLADDERKAISNLIDKKEWKDAIEALAVNTSIPNTNKYDSAIFGNITNTEESIVYNPRDKYALFTYGVTNYITIIENDSTNKLMGVNDADPISMHIMKVVPKYYTGRIVTREDPINLLSQQLSIIYEEAFAGKANGFVFEWRKCSPNPDGTVPTNFDSYEEKYNEVGLTKFVTGQQGDTLANMVNTYYSMRYKAKDKDSPAYAAMGDSWSEWVNPPALAEGWVQRVLNNVTPFSQRMQDLYENEAENVVTMIRQAGAPFEGDVALNQDNLKEVGLIQLYETILNKAESMSLLLGVNNLDANKQLQLAVGRLADLYNVLGDEAYADALNPTVAISTENSTILSDYANISSALFCFDNQVASLLDEELALLRGRDGVNAPVTTLSPYYNRLVWNFTKGITAGEVAYAVNYDISGTKSATIDYQQAAKMFPQGHGDAYGHYLSALSGYYRLLRNPYFSWGEPAMGEMNVADSVVNVDYYDESTFAKSAVNVAKTALEVVDRTGRAAYRDSGSANGAGYLDSLSEQGNASRAFGYGEWASRGVYGAICNWAVANSLVPEEPKSGLYYRYYFTGEGSGLSTKIFANDAVVELSTNAAPWTVEFQILPSLDASSALSGPVRIEDKYGAIAFELSASDEANDDKHLKLSLAEYQRIDEPVVYTVRTHSYTNHTSESTDRDEYVYFAETNQNDNVVVQYIFMGKDAPKSYTGSSDFNSPASSSIGDWHFFQTYDEEKVIHEISYSKSATESICDIPCGEKSLIALSCSPHTSNVTVRVFSSANALGKEHTLTNVTVDVDTDSYMLGGGFVGEIAEFRTWQYYCSNEELITDKEGVAAGSENIALAHYLRPVSSVRNPLSLMEEADRSVWNVSGGDWISEEASGMSIDFNPKGLKRIDRATVTELTSLADTANSIQKKLDQLDSGMNPLGLSSGAVPFDITPIGVDDGTSTHYEQIRARAGVALNNAKKALDKAQESGNRLRLLEESQQTRQDKLDTMELEYKNKLITYFGYPYSGDIGPGGTYEQGYDGPDLYHYAWSEPEKFNLTDVEDTETYTTQLYTFPKFDSSSGNYSSSTNVNVDSNTIVTVKFEKSASGIILKPNNITGSRRANGKIQDALAEFLTTYATFKGNIATFEVLKERFESQKGVAEVLIRHDNAVFGLLTIKVGAYTGSYIAEMVCNTTKNVADITLESIHTTYQTAINSVLSPTVGMAVNPDAQAVASAALFGPMVASLYTAQIAKQIADEGTSWQQYLRNFADIVYDESVGVRDRYKNLSDTYEALISTWMEMYNAAWEVEVACRQLLVAQQKVETVVAEAERILDERELERQQAVNEITKERYKEMFLRITRNNALSCYSSTFDLAQKYVYLAAQAYDYETGLMSSDEQSGEQFLGEIIGARALGEFDKNGNVLVTSGNGDGGLSDILARMDANWLVLKPRLGINNPQPYATWFSLRRELFRIKPDAEGDKAWITELKKYWVDDLSKVKEFTYNCQPFHATEGSVTPEPGLVIPFSSDITFGRNFFGLPIAGGDAAFDSTWYSTHIKSAGVYFDGYNERLNGYSGNLPLSTTPVAYLVPVGTDRMRLPDDSGDTIGWNVVDQTIPLPYAIGATDLDNPNWAPLYNGFTAGNDIGARIRKHPSFRAYYGNTGLQPTDSDLDCTRLVGRSAWNTKWILVIPAGAMGADREKALGQFIEGFDSDRNGTQDVSGVKDIRIGFKTYSKSGN